ncbi:MAG: 30S ribosomal protein S1 [Planctomycetales bacterium]|nr:30S ribosomal protein S1 [bacterium]UNM07654.1 MAG: 30S ribosomal protein S1 [Planctomycetales bacterium]
MTNEFNNLLEEDLAGRSLAVGQVVDGTVVQISEDGVFVDIGAKSEGHLELDQIFQEELATLKVGDPVKVRIIKKKNGEYHLSKKSVDYEAAWNLLVADRKEDKVIEIKVVEKVKNGYMAEAYELLQGFIHHTNFKGRPNVGDTYKAKILDLNRKARKLVFTRRDLLEREETENLERDFGMLQEGMVIEGQVEKLSPYGAFVKITDTLTGLLHISEFSFDHVKKPSEVLKAGDMVQAKILQIDKDKKKISLSRKATMKDPMMTMIPGEELDGKVESLAEFGVFVKMDNGVTGLVHISEISHRRCNHPSEVVSVGDPIRVKVLRIQPEDRRVSLSAKACERDPWTEVYSRYSVGQRVEGNVTQLMQSGMVMKLDEFFEAFIPISEISEERINHPNDMFEEGAETAGTIISIDTAKRRIRVSLRRVDESITDSGSAEVKGISDAGGMGTEITATAGRVTLGDILGSKLDLTNVSSKDKDAKAEEKPAAKAEEAPVAEVVAEEAASEAAEEETVETGGEGSEG